MITLSTHVLDTALGRPAAGVPLRLERQTPDGWTLLGQATTNADGRARELSPAPLTAGVYRLTFDTGRYFCDSGQRGFYPEVPVLFEVQEGAGHYHVPLLISPWGYSTYRGS